MPLASSLGRKGSVTLGYDCNGKNAFLALWTSASGIQCVLEVKTVEW